MMADVEILPRSSGKANVSTETGENRLEIGELATGNVSQNDAP